MIDFRAKHVTGFIASSPLQPFVFPDGAVHIKGAEDQRGQWQYQIADVRGMSHDELFLLAMWADACDSRGEKKVLLLPYLPGARADRGLPFGAEVYADFLNSLFIDQIVTLDPHSPVMPGLITNTTMLGAAQNNLTIFPFERIIKREIQDGSSDVKGHPYDGVIAPDKGAVDRATRAATVMGVPVYLAGKTRDFETGKLTGFHMEDELPEGGRYLIVDDICDGGGTFLGLAKSIYGGGGGQVDNPKHISLDLWVTHGVFSKGLREFPQYFNEVHTTNSYATKETLFQQHIHDHDVYELTEKPFLHIHDVTPYLYEAINV